MQDELHVDITADQVLGISDAASVTRVQPALHASCATSRATRIRMRMNS
jgi:hypothetical protein